MTHLSGWCSPDCTPRSHATCQERIDAGLLDGCDCPDHTTTKDAA
jgi:hypothetical protein